MKSKHISIKQVHAFLPIVMSLIALVLVFGHIVFFGNVHENDEGTLAHLWQLLMAGQIILTLFFAIKYVPINPKQALPILVVQMIAIMAACAPVFIFKL